MSSSRPKPMSKIEWNREMRERRNRKNCIVINGMQTDESNVRIADDIVRMLKK